MQQLTGVVDFTAAICVSSLEQLHELLSILPLAKTVLQLLESE